jgi:hypothetical protein
MGEKMTGKGGDISIALLDPELVIVVRNGR